MEGKKSKFVFLNSGHYFFILKTMAMVPCSHLAVPFSSLHFSFILSSCAVWGGFLFEVTHVKFLCDSCKNSGLFNK